MRTDLVKSLVKIDLIANARQRTSEKRKDKITMDNILRQTFFSQLFVLLIFGGIYLVPFLAVPFEAMAAVFSQSVGLLSFMVLFTTLTLIYGLFYDENSFRQYMPLPIKSKELFAAKVINILTNTVAFLIPILAFMLVLAYKSPASNFYTFPMAILLTGLLYFIMVAASMVLVHLLLQIPWVRQRADKVIPGLTIVLIVVMILVITVSNNEIYESTASAGQVEGNSLFLPIYDLLVQPGQATSWLGGAAYALIAIILYIVLDRWIIPGLFKESGVQEKTPSQQRPVERGEHRALPSKFVAFFKYQLKQISTMDIFFNFVVGNLIFQVVFLSGIYGIFTQESSLFRNIHWSFFGAILVLAFIMALNTYHGAGLSSVILSLEKSNYPYMMSLPISFDSYIRFKFFFAFGLDFLVLAVIYLVLFLLVGLDPWAIAVFILGLFLGTLTAAFINIAYDYNNLSLDWSNANELLQRRKFPVVQMMASFLIITILFLGGFFGAIWLASLTESQRLWVSLGLAALVFLVLILTYIYSNRKLWSQLTD